MQNCKLCGEPYDDDMLGYEGFCSYDCWKEANDVNMDELGEPDNEQ